MFRKKSELERLADRQEAREFDAKYDDNAGGPVTFLRERGVRETFESILIAIVLALLFRNFLGEAYIIPTGSMAPSLQGRHMDVMCDKCGYEYRTGASIENNVGSRSGVVLKNACPICQNVLELRRNEQRDHRSFAGDRILVNKFIYDFQSPKRWDVIVFKYPNNGKQNYIKRCVGIPGEGLLIECGDIFTYDLDTETFEDRKIARKDHRKLQAMLQLVDDTNFIAPEMKEVGWPSRWQQWGSIDSTWNYEFLDKGMKFSNPGSSAEMQWLRYRHLRPQIEVELKIGRVENAEWYWYDVLDDPNSVDTEWDMIESGTKPDRLAEYKGELITDLYAYNEGTSKRSQLDQSGRPLAITDNSIGIQGMHWVGDIGLEADLEIKSSQGTIAFDVVEGGVHFTCKIDIGSGQASFSASDPVINFRKEDQDVADPPAASTPLKGPGKYSIRFVNADDRLYLWVNDRPVEFEVSEYRRDADVIPKWTEADAFDAEPLGIGSEKVEMAISRIKAVRDVYYVSANKETDSRSTDMEYLPFGPPREKGKPQMSNDPRTYIEIFRHPEQWNSDLAIQVFNARKRNKNWVFELNKNPDHPEKDSFMPMGDNSPQSSDARIWPGPPHISREYLLGRAMYVYWPHAKTRPLPFWPNFERMKLIR